jgi:Ca-activated chloride channel family protein
MVRRLFPSLASISSALTSFSCRLLLAAIVAALLAAPAQAQDDDVIKFNVDLVTVNVAVRDGKGRSLLGLKPHDFRITDENNPVIPEFFDSDGPASIIFVVDVSSSMKGEKWKGLMSGLRNFLKKARDGNDYTLIAFSNNVQVLAKSVSAAELLSRLRELKPFGETALYDGVLMGFDVLKQLPQRHKALVLISDGEDNSSRLGLAEVEKSASASRTTIYSIGLLLKDWCKDGYQNACVGQETVSRLAKVSGGLAYFPDSPWELSSVLKEISTDVSNQYSFSYYPPDKKSGWRQVHVALAQTEQRSKLRYQQRYLMR